jgi:hypothetical protein
MPSMETSVKEAHRRLVEEFKLPICPRRVSRFVSSSWIWRMGHQFSKATAEPVFSIPPRTALKGLCAAFLCALGTIQAARGANYWMSIAQRRRRKAAFMWHVKENNK